MRNLNGYTASICISTIAIWGYAHLLSLLPVHAESGASKLDRALSTRDFLKDDAHDEFAKNTPIDFRLSKRKTNEKEVGEIVQMLQEASSIGYRPNRDPFIAVADKYNRSITAIRGGGDSKRVVGCYVGTFAIHYLSDYKNLSLPNVGYWAYDFHNFMVRNNGWYKRMAATRYIHYEDKERFARAWFERLDKNFVKLDAAAQSAFLHDAIEDAIVVYWYYDEHKHLPIFERSASWLGWEIRESEKRN